MKTNEIQIRETQESDFNEIMTVEELAFGNTKEAELVANLLKDPSAQPAVSLLAFNEKEAIGHILYTKLTVRGSNCKAYLLAPLAIKPAYQNKGIGGKLIHAGLDILAKRGVELVFVLGHMEYYPKHGFIPDAGKFGFPAPYPIPSVHADAWMIQELSSSKIDKYSGQVECATALNKEEYWRE